MKQRTVFCCSECGNETVKWSGRCTACGAWDSLVEIKLDAKAKGSSKIRTAPKKLPKLISELDTEAEFRFSTGIGELDRVLGGGAVKGSLVLVGGDPGIGKSTLLLQMCYNLAKNEYTNGIMNTSDFCIVIKAVSETVPIKAVSLFSDYLIELNRQKENDADVQEEIVLALISALGAIGDKNAFDSLLSVTYYDYSDEVINKARSALAGLKW